MRLDLAGGWTDVPPFSPREGGVVVTAAIRLFARAEVRLGGSGFRLVSRDLRDELEVSDSAGLVRDGRLDLLKAGLRMLPVGACTLTTCSDAPPGSGLGSSGALDVALVAALSAARGESPDPVDIAERACHLEAVEAGIPGGRQDQFASSHGGFLRLDFRDPDAEVRRLKLDPEFAADLGRRIVLCYTSASRFSGATIDRVMRAYERGDHRGLGGAARPCARWRTPWRPRSWRAMSPGWDASSPRTGLTSRRSILACVPTKWPVWSRRSPPPERSVARRRARARVAACSFSAPTIRKL